MLCSILFDMCAHGVLYIEICIINLAEINSLLLPLLLLLLLLLLILLLLLLFMVAHSNGQAIIFYPCGFYFLSSFFLFFPRLISVVGDWMPTILPHMMWL